MVLASVASLAGGLAGAFQGGALGFAVAALLDALLRWWELRAAIRKSDMVATDDRNAERRQEPEREPRPAAQCQDAIEPVSPSQASYVPPVPPGSYEAPSRLTHVAMPPNRFASHGLLTTPMPWSTQVTWAVVIGTDWTYYERMWMGRTRYSLPSYSRNTARSGDLCLLDSKCLSGDAVQPGILNRT